MKSYLCHFEWAGVSVAQQVPNQIAGVRCLSCPLSVANTGSFLDYRIGTHCLYQANKAVIVHGYVSLVTQNFSLLGCHDPRSVNRMEYLPIGTIRTSPSSVSTTAMASGLGW